MKTELFDFDLPEHAIALRPASPRDHAKLLQVKGGVFSDHHVFNLPDLLVAGDVLVLNDTKVFPAALTALRRARAHGGGGDVTLDINLLSDQANGVWQAFARPAKRLKTGDILTFSDALTAEVLEKRDGGEVVLQFNQFGSALYAAFDAVGSPPLPPYIARKREPDAQDTADYQTVFAKHKGSVAAPTAGLHFTPELMRQLSDKGVQVEYLTLHVGAGTFLPVKSDETSAHIMHSEWYDISESTAQSLRHAKEAGRRIVAVGTTALRALEAASETGPLVTLCANTDIFITPGYTFRFVDGLMTNFHLPKSTLFMLVSALAGRETMQKAYQHALSSGYRFYSYGDSSLLWAQDKQVSADG